MRHAVRLFAIVAVLTTVSVSGVLAADDAESVRRVVAGFVTAWNHHDMAQFGKLFAPDADFVNVAGFRMKGRQDIQMHHAWAHGAIPQTTSVPGTTPANYGVFKNSTMKFDAVDVRFLRNDIALAHVNWQLSGDARLATPRHGILLFVLTHGRDGWQIEAAQNTEMNRTVK